MTDHMTGHMTDHMAQSGLHCCRNWRGNVKTIECPKDSGHHVVYASLPKNCKVHYRWMLMDEDKTSIKEKELQRSINLGEEDLTVQDCFGDYTSLLPQVFQPGVLK